MESMGEKLVRDNMPELCSTTPGWSPMTFRVAKADERIRLLIDKLKEEVQELHASIEDPFGKKPQMVEEFADVKQVLMDLISQTTATEEEIEQVRLNKWVHRGGFTKFFVWDGKK
jgi:predicted house-cleaning noncanonical NTP pyrophosphatase (MazG superfamily)